MVPWTPLTVSMISDKDYSQWWISEKNKVGQGFSHDTLVEL